MNKTTVKAISDNLPVCSEHPSFVGKVFLRFTMGRQSQPLKIPSMKSIDNNVYVNNQVVTLTILQLFQLFSHTFKTLISYLCTTSLKF